METNEKFYIIVSSEELCAHVRKFADEHEREAERLASQLERARVEAHDRVDGAFDAETRAEPIPGFVRDVPMPRAEELKVAIKTARENASMHRFIAEHIGPGTYRLSREDMMFLGLVRTNHYMAHAVGV